MSAVYGAWQVGVPARIPLLNVRMVLSERMWSAQWEAKHRARHRLLVGALSPTLPQCERRGSYRAWSAPRERTRGQISLGALLLVSGRVFKES